MRVLVGGIDYYTAPDCSALCSSGSGTPKADGTQECSCMASNRFSLVAAKNKSYDDYGYFPPAYGKYNRPLSPQGSISPDDFRGRTITALYSHNYNGLKITFLIFKRPKLDDLSDITMVINKKRYTFKLAAIDEYGNVQFNCNEIIFSSTGNYTIEFLD